MQREPKRDRLIPALLLGLGVALIWLPFLFRIASGQTALAGLLEYDIGFQWIPFKEFTREAFKEGYFPLWCPYLFAGMPFLAFSHTQVLYPLGWLLVFFDYAKAVNFYYPLHLSLGFLGFYLLLSNLGISRFVSFLVSLSTILSGKFFYFIHYLPVASSNFWGIWFFYFVVKLSKQLRLKFLLGLALSLALEILGGDIESTTYQLFFTPFFLALMLRRNDQKIFSRVWIFLILGILVGILLAFIQFLPLFEYSKHFLRSIGYTFQGFEARTFSLSLIQALFFPGKNLLGPGFSTPASYLYLGLVGLFFPFYALFLTRKNLGLFLLATFALFFSFGSFKWLDWLIYQIPFLNRLGAQEHCFFLFQIFWAILVGRGIEESLKDKRRGLLWFFVFSLLLVLQGEFYFPTLGLRKTLLIFSGLALITSIILFRIKPVQNWHKFALGFLFLLFLIDLYELALITLPQNSPSVYQLPTDLASLKKFAGRKDYRSAVISKLGVNDPILLHHLGLRTGVGTIDGWITIPPLDYAKFLNLIEPRSLILKDGKIEEFGFNIHFREGKFIQADTLPLLDLLSLKYFLVREMNLKFASPYSLALSSSDPIYLEKGDWLKADLIAEEDGSLEINLERDGQSDLIYQRAFRAGDQTRLEIDLSKFAGQIWKLKFNLFSSTAPNPRKIIFRDLRIENERRPIQRIFRNEIEIFENRGAFPQAFLVHNCRWFSDPEMVLSELKRMSQWDLSKEILLARESRFGKIVAETGSELKANWIDPHKLKEPLQTVKEMPEELIFQVYLLYPGYLFLNHQYLPGWRAYVDGVEFPIEKANYCFRAVFLERGLHQIQFRYEPISFRIGLWVSLAMLFSWVLLGMFSKSKRLAIRQ